MELLKQEDTPFNRIAQELLCRSGSPAEIVIEERFPGPRLVGGRYHMASDTIYLYKAELKQQCLQLFGSLDRLEEYIAVVCAHEIGHAEDQELPLLSELLDESAKPREKAEIALHIEENAWRYAEGLLYDLDPAFTQTIVDESLSSYRVSLLSLPA